MMLRTAPSTHASFIRGMRVGCSRWFRCWVAAAAVLSLANNNNIFLVTALSSSSPWKTGYWQLTVNLGREPTTTLPEVWGQSGARLVFPVALGADANPLGSADDAYWQGHTANHLQVLTDIPNTATYITERGQQRVPLVERGGWRLTTTRRNAKQGEASLLRFWLDINNDNDDKNAIVAQKRDTTLCAGDRLYFSAHCWRESQYEAGVRRMRPIQAAYEQAKDAVTQQLSHDDGDRRLDGTNALDTLAAYRDMATLTMDRDQKRRAWKEAQEYLPLLSSALSQRSNLGDVPMGHWPGSTERLMVQPREVLVRRRGGDSGGIFGSGILAQDEFHVVGKWTIKPLEMEEEEEDDDEYEYYYEDDDEDEEDDDEEDFDDDDAEEEYEQSSRETERRRAAEES